MSGITGSGHGVDLVIGVAGAGKTTMLDVVRMAYEAEGYTVIGTATSGQAARTLGRDANMAPSTGWPLTAALVSAPTAPTPIPRWSLRGPRTLTPGTNR